MSEESDVTVHGCGMHSTAKRYLYDIMKSDITIIGEIKCAKQYSIAQTGTSFPSNQYLFGSTQGTYYFSSGLVYSSHY